MIHITYSGWVALFCILGLIQVGQSGLILWFVFKKRENKDPIPDIKIITEQLKKDLIKDAQARTAILIKLFRPEQVIEENQAQHVDIK